MPSTHSAAEFLLRARDPRARLRELPEALRPADAAGAYAIQRAIAASLGPIGGWKVGATGPDAPVNCAPMPASGIAPSPGALGPGGMAVEAEVAFRVGHDLPPRAAPYSRDEIIAALGAAHPAIEWLESRYADPATMDRWSQLADSLMHGGFVWGAGVADWHAMAFETMTVTQDVASAVLERTGNPAGDMIRLVQWLADEGAVWAGGLRAGQFVTCGSWTGKTAARAGQRVLVRFAGLGEVSSG